MGEHAPQGAAPCSAPEINGPVVQREFTSLLRETCSPSPSVTVGAVARNGCRAGAGVSRGRSTESHEPGTPGGSHNSGRAELGRQNTTSGGLVPGALKPMAEHWAAITMAEKEWLRYPTGLPGTAVRGPACTVVWEAGGAIPGAIPPPTRLALIYIHVL